MLRGIAGGAVAQSSSRSALSCQMEVNVGEERQYLEEDQRGANTPHTLSLNVLLPAASRCSPLLRPLTPPYPLRLALLGQYHSCAGYTHQTLRMIAERRGIADGGDSRWAVHRPLITMLATPGETGRIVP